MLERLAEIVDQLEGEATMLDVAALDARLAVRATKLFGRIESIGAAGKGRTGRRVDETNAWVRDGHRSAAHAMAAITGTSVGQATGSLQTAERLEHLGQTAEAFAKGKLSPAQAAEIAHAASEVPDAEDELLLAAPDLSFSKLRDRCRRIAASAHDPLERAKRIHASRFCRTWTDPDGAWNLTARGTTADGGRIMAALGAEADQVFKAARARGDREPLEAYRFDALRNLTTREGQGSTSGPKAHVHVNVDAEALLSLKGVPGATCEIPGLGAIPVQDARALLRHRPGTRAEGGRVLRRGSRAGSGSRPGSKTRPSGAGAERGSRGSTRGRRPSAAPGRPGANPVTTVAGVVRICHWDHYLVTHCGYTLEPLDDGQYRLLAPDDPSP